MRQELVFIGQGLNKEAMIKTLDDCILSEEEVLRGKDYWATLPDPSSHGVRIATGNNHLTAKSYSSNPLSAPAKSS